MLKKILLIVIGCIFVLRAEVYEGFGEAVLGNGITLEKAEEIAMLLSQRDAVSKFGVEIKSVTVVKNYVLVSDEISAIASGVVKVVEGSKKTAKKLDNDVIKIVITAKFSIDKSNYFALLEKYSQRKKADSSLQDMTIEIAKEEKKLNKIAVNLATSNEDVETAVESINKKYESLGSAIKYDASSFLSSINSDTINRLNGLKKYIEELKKIDITKLHNIKITKINSKDINSADRINLEISGECNPNIQMIKKLQSVYDKYKKFFYSNDQNHHFIVNEIYRKLHVPPKLHNSFRILGLDKNNDVCLDTDFRQYNNGFGYDKFYFFERYQPKVTSKTLFTDYNVQNYGLKKSTVKQIKEIVIDQIGSSENALGERNELNVIDIDYYKKLNAFTVWKTFLCDYESAVDELILEENQK